MKIEGAGLSWRYWEDESGKLVTQMSNWPQNEFILQKYSLDIQISNYVTNVFINLLTSPASALKVLMTLQGLHVNKFISRVTYFNVANLSLHLSPKWSKIKVQKTFNLFFDYKTLETLESSGPHKEETGGPERQTKGCARHYNCPQLNGHRGEKGKGGGSREEQWGRGREEGSKWATAVLMSKTGSRHLETTQTNPLVPWGTWRNLLSQQEACWYRKVLKNPRTLKPNKILQNK